MSPSKEIRADLLGQVFNHLVLPPEIPGSQDDDVDLVSQNVLSRLIQATEVAINLQPETLWQEAFRDIEDSLNVCFRLNRGRLERSSLLQHFKNLIPGRMLVLYLNEQNAGLLIRYDERCVPRPVVLHHPDFPHPKRPLLTALTSEDEAWIIFESFEASASSSHVLAAGHAMQWDFPGRSARILFESFAEKSFQESFASFLEQASMESLYSLQASSQKAGVSVGEIRDTTNPALITQMLISLLEAVGTHYQAPVLRKRIRDDVNLGNSNIPWRRLPFWLILRVATQRQLCLALGAEKGQVAYKLLLAILLAELLDDSAENLSPHKVAYLRTKLARRMAKLEMNQRKVRLHKDVAYDAWFTAVSAVVRNSIQNANMKMEAAWDTFKKINSRHIIPLPYRAPPTSLELTLPNSGDYLDGVLSTKLSHASTLGPVTLPNPLDQSIQQSQEFTDYAFHLAALEERVESEASRPANPRQNYAARCVELESQIEDVLSQMKRAFKTIGSTYDSSPEQNSATILAIFTLWVELDRSAIAECQLLGDHAPVFHPELLDALQLPTKLAMERLHKIQKHLADRHAKSIHGNILETHAQDSVALRYSAHSRDLQSLEHCILDDYANARQRKRQEHEDLCNKYDEHTEGIADNPCLCIFEDGEWIVSGCTSCWHRRARHRLKIQVQEAFLPKNNPARSTIVFELGIPDWLSAYRSATWQIMNRLAHPYRPKGAKPEIYLRECEPLQGYMTAKSKRLSMASRIKCFEQTHYNFSQGKAPLTRVLLPFATDFRLYDSISNVWVADLARPLTLEHLCGIQIPRSLRGMFPKTAHPPTIVDGPSSYTIQANQTLAPKDTPVQAFSACQKILAGKRRRWPNLLVELSSSNLNLSDEDVMRVICQLASQAGPGIPDEPLRAVHEVFKYPAFTRQLEGILQRLLESIQTNWREHNIMQLVITLALRLHCLAGQSLSNETLIAARKCLVEWISELRGKIQATKDSSEAQRYATYGLYAALLCRRTFAAFLGSRNHISSDDLSTWIQVSIAIQENMLHDLSRLPDAIRDLLFRDAKMVYHLQNNVRGAMETYRSIVGIEILKYWSGHFMHTEQTFAPWGFLPEPHGRWIVATTPGRFMERLHFNYIEGHLLVNGRPRSKLPRSIANDDAVMSIFGVQHLITYPSNQPGMSHRLAHANRGLQIHFGLRDKRAVIRAVNTGSSNSEETWEFVPQSKLGIPGNFDLPTELIKNCGHWLNINTRCLEIRRGSLLKTTYYSKRENDWFIDIPRRRAYRGEGGSQLVDPHSETFAQIASILADFEQADRLTVFQPQNLASRLTVELKHLDLHFVVNQNRLLYCQQLNAEIDIDQDAGTWYGLRSKIVMREVNTRSRSIIVPLGKLIARPNGFHVDVRIREAAHYARFTIDDIIGRLSCSPEPRLIYTKALYHATTSFCLPDTLTGRTGSSEAFSILRSGTSQPWIPVIKAVNETLEELSKLAPRREYHPPNIRRIQRVSWDPNLTPSIQCDGYIQLIQEIREKSNNLEAFTTGSEFELKEISHLSCRGRSQREIYDPLLDAETSQGIDEAVYSPRDRISGMESAQVYQIACVIHSNCSQFRMSRSLSTILESSDIIGGFSNPETQTATSYSGPLINQIEDPVIEKWGELIEFCRHKADRASLLFRLGLLAFHSKADMDVIHSLAAICLVDKIRKLNPPRYQHFADFKSRERPSMSLLEGLIGSTYPKFKPEISRKGQPLWFDAESRNAIQFEEACKEEGVRLAKHILQYWPIPATDITTEMLNSAVHGPQNGQPYLMINVDSALDKTRPEWERRYANLELSNYIRRVDGVLSLLCRVHDITTPMPWVTREPDFVEARKTLSYRSIVRNWSAKRGPILEVVKSSLADILEEYQENAARQQPITDALPELNELEKIIQNFGHSTNNLRKQYGRDLSQSLAALKMRTQQIERDDLASVPQFGEVKEALRRAQAHVEHVWSAIATASTAEDNRACWLELGAMKPLSTAVDVLKLLRSTESIAFGPGMKEAIVSYGIALTDVQHLTRIQRALLANNRQALHNELRQLGHTTWRPIEIPDWLLLEIDSNIIIRDEQVNVAKAMIDPTLGNGVLQLSMGKGKTSCIIPMVVAVLANGQSLSRVVVPKALIMQTAQTLQSRLGGLVGRQVIHFPFSRKTPTGKQILDLYAELHHRTRRSYGIVLTCAEHLLSYKLSGWQQFIDSKKSTAEQMIRFQEWLNTHCRDMLDKCDFTLSVKTQLNYPSGSEMSIDFHPYRAATETALHDRIVEDVCSGRVTLLRPASSQYQQKERAIRKVLCGTKISKKLLSRVATLFENPEIALNALLLNVQYGLHPDRDPMAVPFEAKGKPSEQAEYGHPDVAIIFTYNLKTKGVSMLINVGAYISKMDNQELAHTWLLVDCKAKAVVYFRNNNQAWVHYRNNTKEDVPLLATPLAEDLSGCNVFLDEGHTRGVDLRLPSNACGAVTLALKLTKDHAVQAAMRLRQLQTTQKVCFYGPRAVVSSIKDFYQLRPYNVAVQEIHDKLIRTPEALTGTETAGTKDFARTVWFCLEEISDKS
ncbi:hypothetical protein NPX13_g6562 [Xylaria arbuscula]|uniref:ubiquitinyl hydrolase 1 n=1 Tax=Xylaria arbuscula TaxID=114810 RepID=A0A9W8NBL9_9PEZI|nr:hypothetical protein NPX13_g6562 [Xylaria arbuscula]